MAIANRYVVLYFVRGPIPSEAQVTEARRFGPHAMFRNVLFHREGDGCEPCTAVAGEVPAEYKKFPAAVSYMDWLDGLLPHVEATPSPGELGMGTDRRELAARIIDPEAPRPNRKARAAAAVAVQPLSGMTGTDSPLDPPPPPAPPHTMTAGIELPPPPPPPPEG